MAPTRRLGSTMLSRPGSRVGGGVVDGEVSTRPQCCVEGSARFSHGLLCICFWNAGFPDGGSWGEEEMSLVKCRMLRSLALRSSKAQGQKREKKGHLPPLLMLNTWAEVASQRRHQLARSQHSSLHFQITVPVVWKGRLY